MPKKGSGQASVASSSRLAKTATAGLGRRLPDLDWSGVEVPCCLKFAWMARTFLDALSKQLQKVLQTVSNELFHEEQMDEMPEPRHLSVSPTPNILTSKPFWTVCLRHDAGGGT